MATESEETLVVVDAATRFVSQGGNWWPSGKLARLIDQVALDRIKYTRLYGDIASDAVTDSEAIAEQSLLDTGSYRE